MPVTLYRCDWCGDHWEAHALRDARMTDRTVRICPECAEVADHGFAVLDKEDDE